MAGKRTAEIAPWKQGQNVTLLSGPKSGTGVVAYVGSGVVALIGVTEGKAAVTVAVDSP